MIKPRASESISELLSELRSPRTIKKIKEKHMPGYPDLSSQIQNLSGDAARFVLLTFDAAVSLQDLPALIERAGLVFD